MLQNLRPRNRTNTRRRPPPNRLLEKTLNIRKLTIDIVKIAARLSPQAATWGTPNIAVPYGEIFSLALRPGVALPPIAPLSKRALLGKNCLTYVDNWIIYIIYNSSHTIIVFAVNPKIRVCMKKNNVETRRERFKRVADKRRKRTKRILQWIGT